MTTRSGADTLRLVVTNMNDTHEDFNDRYSAEQLLQIYQMQLASRCDFYPHQWTPRQVAEALRGVVPAWDSDDQPVYT